MLPSKPRNLINIHQNSLSKRYMILDTRSHNYRSNVKFIDNNFKLKLKTKFVTKYASRIKRLLKIRNITQMGNIVNLTGVWEAL